MRGTAPLSPEYDATTRITCFSPFLMFSMAGTISKAVAQQFQFSKMTSVQYAAPLASPLPSATYGPALSICSSLLPSFIIYITYRDPPIIFGQGVPIGPLGTLRSGYDNVTLADSFLYYAKILLTRYGDRVPTWITFNDPNINSDYSEGFYNVLVAHAKVWHFYDETLQGLGIFPSKWQIILLFH